MAKSSKNENYKYWAFISYSHQDEAWAKWLHKALETYYVPRRLVGKKGHGEVIPRRLQPIFRDRDELAGSSELGAALEQALKQSRNLIVICSPAAAKSRWVNEEILKFRQLGRQDRIFCLLVAGEPGAILQSGNAHLECFPVAIRGGDGISGLEPIAADVRPSMDGKLNGKLKLVAGLLNLGLDDLKQRDRQRRIWQRVQISVLALLICGVLLGTWMNFERERLERERQLQVDELVSAGRLALSSGQHGRAAVYLNEALAMGHDNPALRFMLGRAMRTVDSFSGTFIEHGGDAVRKAVFSQDGSRIALVVVHREGALARTTTAQIYDTGTGDRLAEFSNVPLIPRTMMFLPGNDQLFIRGYESDVQPNKVVAGIWKIGVEAAIFQRESGQVVAGQSFSPDLAILAVPANEGAGLELIDTATIEIKKVLASEHAVTAVSFSANGKHIAILDSKGLISILTGQNFQERRKLKMSPLPGFDSLVFRPDGRKLIALSRAGDLRQWDLESGNLDLSFAVEFHGLATFQFSDDSRRFLTIGQQSGYSVWNAERGVRLMSLAASASPKLGRQILADGVLSADGNTLYTADHANSAVQVWDTLSQRRLYDIEHHAEAVTSVALSHDGRQLLVASADGFAELTQLRPNTIHREQSVVFNPGSLSIDASGQYLVTAGAKGAQGFVQRRDLQQLDAVETFASYPTYFFDVQWDSASQYVVAGAQNGNAVLYDASSGQIMNQLPAVAGPIESISISQNRLLVKPWSIPGVEVAAASLWSLPQGEKLSSMQHARAIYDARFGQAGSVVATAGDDGDVAVWNSADGQLMNKFRASENAVYSLDISKVGAQIATADASGQVVIWNFRDGRELFRLADSAIGTPLHIKFSQQGDALALGTSTGAWLWRPSSAELLEMSGQQDVVKLAFLHAGKMLLAGGLDGSVVAWDSLSGEPLGRIAFHYGPIRGFAVDPTESTLATADFNGEFALWNLAIETRNSNLLKIDLKCKIPWKLRDGKLTAAIPACRTRKSPIKNSP